MISNTRQKPKIVEDIVPFHLSFSFLRCAAGGFVILKGGTGTLLELAYVWEFINKKFIKEKPIVIVGDYWTRVVDTLKEELLWEGLGDCTKFIRRVDSPREGAALLKEKLTQRDLP